MRVQAFSLFLAVLLFSSFITIPAFATAPTAIAPDTGVSVSNYRFELYSTSTYVTFASNFYADAIYIASNYVNFTNIALSSSANPTQTFGIGMQNGNATISGIAQNTVTTTVVCSSSTCIETFYYDTSTPIYIVDVTTNGVLTQIEQTNFLTSVAAFNAASAPVVLWDAVSHYVQAKVPVSTTSTSVFYFSVQPPVGSGGGGSGGPPPVGTTLNATVNVPEFTVLPGRSQTQNITVYATGYTVVTVSEITYDTVYSSWFAVSSGFPIRMTLQPDQTTLFGSIPLTVTIPADMPMGQYIVMTKIKIMTNNVNAVEVLKPMTVNVGYSATTIDTDQGSWIIGGLIVGVAIVAILGMKHKR